MKMAIAAVPMMLAATALSAAPAKPVSLKSYLTGNTLIMTAKRIAPQTVKLRANGTYDFETEAVSSDSGTSDPLDGTWYIKGKSVCLHMDSAQVVDLPDNCYPVEVVPPHGQWTGKPVLGGYQEKEVWTFQLWRAGK